ncbi:transmembrane protein 150A isoform X3 [Oryzias latipes]
MSLWMILPVSLPVFTITGIWVVYAMALYNQHVCPVQNWLYNESCVEPLPLQRSPVLCCTLDNVPLISKCGTLPPESCFFSLVCSTGSFMVMLVGLLRYAHVIEKHHNCVLNTAGLSTGWICAAGLIMVGNFQGVRGMECVFMDFVNLMNLKIQILITKLKSTTINLNTFSFSLYHRTCILIYIEFIF